VQNWGWEEGWLPGLRQAEVKIMMIDRMELRGDRQVEEMVRKLRYGF
jgi:hypothetical protein